MKTSKFKMTEVGPIPEDWSIVPLGDLFSFKNGYNTSAECYGAGTPVASVLEALDWMPLTRSRIRTKVIAPEGARSAFSLKQGDLIFTRSSETLEDVGRSNVYVDDEPAMFGGFIIRGRPKTGNNSCFINFLLKDQKHHERIMSKGAGAQHYNIGQTGLAKVLITLPPLPEQERIAEALSDVDALLSAMTTLIEKKRAIKQGAMQQLLTGKTRLQGFGAERAEFKQTELGPIPNDWDVKRIDQCGDVVTGSTPPRGISELWGGSFNWISARDFKGKYIISSEETVTDAGKRYCRALPANSVLITCIASIGLNAIAKQSCATNQQINAVVCRECDYEYFYYQCCLNESRLRQIAGQTAVPIIGKSQFEEFSILLILIAPLESRSVYRERLYG